MKVTTSLPCHRTQGNAEEKRGAVELCRTTLPVPRLSVFAAAAAATGSAAATITRGADTAVAFSAERLARTAEASEFQDHPVGILRVAPNGLHAFAQGDFYLDRCEHEKRVDSFNFIYRQDKDRACRKRRVVSQSHMFPQTNIRGRGRLTCRRVLPPLTSAVFLFVCFSRHFGGPL